MLATFIFKLINILVHLDRWTLFCLLFRFQDICYVNTRTKTRWIDFKLDRLVVLTLQLILILLWVVQNLCKVDFILIIKLKIFGLFSYRYQVISMRVLRLIPFVMIVTGVKAMCNRAVYYIVRIDGYAFKVVSGIPLLIR